MRGIPGTAFVSRREPQYAYAQSPHYVANLRLAIPFSDFPTDPPRDSDFEDALTIAGERAHRPAMTNINAWWNPPQWDSQRGVMGWDDFIPQGIAHPTIPLGASSPYGTQLPYAERFNNSPLANDTTSYNTIVDKLVAAVKLRRKG